MIASLLPFVLVASLLGGPIVRGSGGGGGGSLCPGSFLHCEDFELDSTDLTCDNEGFDLDVAQDFRDCDCTTSSGCTDTTRPATVPEGAQVIDFRNPATGGIDKNVLHQNDVDDADSFDTQYMRACVRWVAANSGDVTPFELFGMRNDAAAWVSTFSGTIRTTYDSTPELRVRAPSSDDQDSTAIAVSSPTNWHEITLRLVESTAVMELCLDQEIGDVTCVISDGDHHTGKVDGYRITMRGTDPTLEGASVRIQVDAVRWSSSDFGASEGCSGL